MDQKMEFKKKCKPGSYLKCLPQVRADKCKNKLSNKI